MKGNTTICVVRQHLKWEKAKHMTVDTVQGQINPDQTSSAIAILNECRKACRSGSKALGTEFQGPGNAATEKALSHILSHKPQIL